MNVTTLNTWFEVEVSWNVMAHGNAREGKWRGNWRMDWVARTLHATSEHGVSNFTTADAHTSAASSRLNWRPRRFKWTRPFGRKKKSGFCACAITFQSQSTTAVLNDSISLRNRVQWKVPTRENKGPNNLPCRQIPFHVSAWNLDPRHCQMFHWNTN